jgi:hypothetical protein
MLGVGLVSFLSYCSSANHRESEILSYFKQKIQIEESSGYSILVLSAGTCPSFAKEIFDYTQLPDNVGKVYVFTDGRYPQQNPKYHCTQIEPLIKLGIIVPTVFYIDSNRIMKSTKLNSKNYMEVIEEIGLVY